MSNCSSLAALNALFGPSCLRLKVMKQSYLNDSDSEDELPPGWIEKVSDTGLVCYINQHSEAAQWSHPRTGRMKKVDTSLPNGWEQSFDKESNRAIFYNKLTQQSTYADPRLAFAAERPPLDVSKVRQRFDSNSTAFQILHGKDLHGRIAVITGANCGIGFETARSLVLSGCEVVFACRNRAATEEAIQTIEKEKPTTKGRCHFLELNLSSLASVDNFVAQLKQSFQHIDYLILNAAVFALPYGLTEDGYEQTFQICHLSHFHLTLQLKSLLDHTSRVVVVSSESHRYSNLPADNLTEQHLSPPPKAYYAMMAYNNAKMCNVLMAGELAKRWQHLGISVFSLHPGNMVSSQLSRNWWFYRLLFSIVRPFTKSLQQAAATTVYCATADELTGLTGYYFNNCYFCEPKSVAKNENLRQQLWKISEQMIERRLSKNSNTEDNKDL